MDNASPLSIDFHPKISISESVSPIQKMK
jgi:hypothetical protein